MTEEQHLQTTGLGMALRYSAAVVAAILAFVIWRLVPAMHQDPFSIFLAAVVVSAHFLGFGPALACMVASALTLDRFIFVPQHMSLFPNDLGRLLVFLLVAVLAASLARQRSRAELTALDTQRRLAAIVESSEDAIFSATPEGIITSWNRGAEVLYGYTAEEAVGRHISLLAPPERSAEVRGNTQRLKRGEHIESFQTERMRKDGTRVRVLLSVSPVREPRGRIVGHSVIARDTTALAHAEKALLRNEKLATAGRLATAMAHEINNPLEAITNLLYLARHDGERRDEYFQLADKEVQRLADIVQQTLGYARDRSVAGPLELGSLLDEILQVYSSRLEAKQIRLDKRYLAAGDIRGYASELRQLFSNLILNAVDAMPPGGHLRLRISSTSVAAPGVRIAIADDGCGIGASDRARLFEPFFTTKGEFGTGLGLWVSQGIVEKHGGTIRFRSSTLPGRSGTVFSVFLPASGPIAQAAA